MVGISPRCFDTYIHVLLLTLEFQQSSKLNRSSPTTFTGDYSKPEPGEPYDHCRAAPLFDLGSVRIESNQFKGFNSVKIYGTIVLIDDHGNEFYIFDCKDRNDAKTHILDPATPSCLILENFQPRGVFSTSWRIK